MGPAAGRPPAAHAAGQSPAGEPRVGAALPGEPLALPRAAVDALLADPRARLIDTSPVVMFSIDRALVVRFSAGGFLSRAGVDPLARAGRSVSEVWPGRPDLVALARRAAVDGVSQRLDVHLAGRVLDTIYEPVLVSDEPGRPAAGALGFAMDVTAERAAGRRAAALAALAERQAAAGDDAAGLAAALADVAAVFCGVGVAVVDVWPGAGAGAGAAAEAEAEADADADADAHADGEALAGPQVAVEHGDPEVGALLADVTAALLAPARGARPEPAAPTPLRLDLERHLAGPGGAVLRAAGADALLQWPLTAPSGVLGSLTLLAVAGSRPGLVTDPVKHAFVADLARRAAAALEAAQHRRALRAEQERRARREVRLGVLAAIADASHGTGVLTAGDLERTLRQTAQVLGGAAFVCEVEDREARLVLVAADDPRTEQVLRATGAVPLRDTGLERVVRTGGAALVQHIHRDLVLTRRGEGWRDFAEQFHGSSFSWYPLALAGDTLGLFGAQRALPFDSEELEFLGELSDRLALAEHNRRLAAERDAAAAALADSEQRFRSAFQDGPSGMFLGGLEGDQAGLVLEANPAYARLTGYTHEQLPGLPFRALAHPDEVEVVRAQLTDLATGRLDSTSDERRCVRADGSEIWIRLSLSVVRQPGQPPYVVGHADDITDRLAALAALTETTATLQQALLPRAVQQTPGVQVAARYRGAGSHEQIGGDWYDTVALPSGGLALVIGDVEGHDLTAASVMALVRSAVRSYALEGHPPSVVVERVNTFLFSAGIDRLVTMAYVELYPGERMATVALAGHPAPLVVPGDGSPATAMQVEPGTLLGVCPDLQWRERTVLLPPRSTLMLYTDGLTDFPGARPEQLERVLELVTRHAARTPAELVDALVEAAPHSDDVAVLAARADGVHGPGAVRVLPAQRISAGIARAWLGDLIGHWQRSGQLPVEPGGQDRDEIAQLLVTELVSNAVRHSDRSIEVSARITGSTLRLEVGDCSHRMPVLRDASPGDTGGRGLMLVDTLAGGWGVELTEQGKIVWLELDLAADAGAADLDEENLLARFG